jgi:hypothetical protein
MKVFISYAFNEANKWVEDYVMPLAKALDFEIVTGQKIEGQPLIDAIDDRIRSCAGCVAFATRRNARADGTFETHPWVVNELTRARTLQFKTVEIREKGVTIGDDSEAYVRINYEEGKRDRMLIDLAGVLSTWVVRPVRVQLLPPEAMKNEFIGLAIKGDVSCRYRLLHGGQQIKAGQALIQPYQGGFFVDIEKPPKDTIVAIEVAKANGAGSWMSFGDGLIAVPVQLYST